MKRTAIARKPLPPRRSPEVTPIVECRGVVRRVADTVVVFPKGVKAKPGKRTPTVEETKWMDAIARYGCVACRVLQATVDCGPTEVHHILRGGQRLGHLFTIPLGQPHHRGPSYFARHPWRMRFEQAFGTEYELLAKVKQDLGVFDEAFYEVAK
jgi:hypothetical protein